jgi:predicted PurR-regulated permease PerM
LHLSARGENQAMSETAKRALVATAVAVAVVACAVALWKLKVLIALVFLGFVLAAAMRPGIDALARHRVPRAAGLALHYLGLAAVIGLLLWLVVPRAVDQVSAAIGGVPTSQEELAQQTRRSTGIKHEFLQGVQGWLEDLPSAGGVFHGAITVGVKAFEILIGIFFVVLSLCFWAIGLPFWLLLGIFAGVVEIVPVIGPLVAGAAAVGVGLTESWQLALAAGLVVLGVRLLEDYVVIPRVMGHAVGLSPLLVLVSVTAVGLLFGGFYVLLAIPLVAVLATLVDVLLRDRDPADEEVPAVLFAKESQG